ncbi:MAG TPA: peptide chain release factor-like protein [Candidatus Bathyarchaeia archaeon]|nr:peptide chain release factor-like protein [Candidatus Bathyarchaeia archaeon]
MAEQMRASTVAQYRRRVKINEKDLQEEFVQSSGPGGQNVNKVATCVVLTYLPSGQTVKCQQYRTQAANRVRAREILAERLERQHEQERLRRLAELAKQRARKRRRSRAQQEKVLENKKRRSEKKQSRRKSSHSFQTDLS